MHRRFPILLLVLACLGGGAPEAQRKQLYQGAAHIGNLGNITIVYPAAKGERGRVHRDSAALRASYLRQRYGSNPVIVADREVTDQHLAGHLLVLGWDNALMDGTRFSLPYERDAEGWTFLGLKTAADDDLLWLARSPFAEQRWMTFWSRIDPGLDRFLSFPFIGSDWAVYRDYFVLKQGMFEDKGQWPPVRDPYASVEHEPVELPRVHASKHFVLYANPEDVEPAAQRSVLEAREEALSSAADLLGVAVDDDFAVDLYLYVDAEQKHEWTGVADPVHSLAERGQLFMALEHARVPHPHEEIHLLAARAYGGCSISALYEGLAFVLEHRGNETDLDAYAAMLRTGGAPLQIEALFDNERLRALARRGAGMAPAGLLVHWLRSTGGMERVGAAYGLGRGEAARGLSALLTDADGTQDAEAAFQAWLDERVRFGEGELEFKTAMDRARQRGKAGDFFGMADAYQAALALRPDDTEVLYRLGVAQIEAGLFDEARATFDGLLGRVGEQGPEADHLRAHGLLQVARIAELEGDLDAARAGYRRVLNEPDGRGAHQKAQEALDRM